MGIDEETPSSMQADATPRGFMQGALKEPCDLSGMSFGTLRIAQLDGEVLAILLD